MNYNSRNMIASNTIEATSTQPILETKTSSNNSALEAELIKLGDAWDKQRTKCETALENTNVACAAAEKDVENLLSKVVFKNETTGEVTHFSWEELHRMNPGSTKNTNVPWEADAEKYRSAKKAANIQHAVDELEKSLENEWDILYRIEAMISQREAQSVRGIAIKLSVWLTHQEASEFDHVEKFVVGALQDAKRLS